MNTNVVNKAYNKRDGLDLVLGKPVYTDDIAPKDCLVVKILRSPHPFAKIKSINKELALKIKGIECILTYKDVPKTLVTRAGATYPEPAPLDFRILDKYVRYVGDEVAIIAGATVTAVDKALKSIKVEYEVLEPLLDFEKATTSHVKVHGNTNAKTYFDFGYNPDKNIVGEYNAEVGDVKKGLEESDVILKKTYFSQGVNQMPLEPQKTFTYKDDDNRLVVVSSTQIPFHIKRMISDALEIGYDEVRVIKPRIGGGFGQKQSSSSEFYPAIVTHITGKPAMLIYTRKEVFAVSTRRHPMKFDITIGATKDGIIKAFDVKALSDTGAYGEHAYTTLSACGDKIMSYYNKVVGARFEGQVVYTNKLASGAFRGFGKTQGGFAVESIVNELAKKINMDPTELRLKNIISKGEKLMLCYNKELEDYKIVQDSCELEYCIKRGMELIKWDKKYPKYKVSDTVVRGVGMGLTIQGSGVLDIDSGGAIALLSKNGTLELRVGASDIGTGSDTILPQIMAEVLGVKPESISVLSADTDKTPYDDGAYASSTTYVTGNAVKKASIKLIDEIVQKAKILYTREDLVYTDGAIKGENFAITLKEFSDKLGEEVSCLEKNVCDKEAPPYKASFAEVEVDLETGKVRIIKIVGVIDCGTVINPTLARVQAHGGMLQAVGHVLYEESKTNRNGREVYDSLLSYKIPVREEDVKIIVEFANSYEPSGPFGAKSIGEVVLNATVTSISSAISNAVGYNFRELPLTPEKIYKGIKGSKGM
ncbi:MAG: xanthine dehydrogenase family protein molybdopterin-binding subunit [Lachnospirales bacterium]